MHEVGERRAFKHGRIIHREKGRRRTYSLLTLDLNVWPADHRLWLSHGYKKDVFGFFLPHVVPSQRSAVGLSQPAQSSRGQRDTLCGHSSKAVGSKLVYQNSWRWSSNGSRGAPPYTSRKYWYHGESVLRTTSSRS